MAIPSTLLREMPSTKDLAYAQQCLTNSYLILLRERVVTVRVHLLYMVREAVNSNAILVTSTTEFGCSICKHDTKQQRLQTENG